MKIVKRIILCLLVVSIYTATSSITKYYIDKDKITYIAGDYVSATLTDEIEAELLKSDDINLSVNLNYDLIDTSYLIPGENATSEEAHALKWQRIEIGKEYYTAKNNEMAQKLDGKNYKERYISSYLPCIEYTYDVEVFQNNKSEILSSLSLNEDVKSISVVGNIEVTDSLMSSLSYSGASEVRTSSYRGEGINVGILESGVVKKSHDSLAGADITVYSSIFNVETQHSTKIASILVNQSSGIVPDANLFSRGVSGNVSNELDWFISKNIDVINMSWGDNNKLGIYYTNSALCDFAVQQYGIVIVAASGNNDNADYKVANPGMGYNVLTVGNYYTSDSTIDENSSYVETSGPEKPNLIVPGVNVIVPGFSGFNSGTSFSCAIMTGLVASLMSQYSGLVGNADKVIALVTASCNDVVVNPQGATKDNGYNDMWGTGLYQHEKAQSNYTKIYTYSNSSTSYGTYLSPITTFIRNYSYGAEAKIGIFWYANSDGDKDNTTRTDYRFELYDLTGSLIAGGSSTTSNYAYIHINSMPIGNKFTLKVYQIGTKASSSAENIVVCFG